MSQTEIPQPKDQLEHVESIGVEQPTRMPDVADTGLKGDQAMQLIEDAGGSTTLTPENNKRVLRKIDLRLLPILLSIYFLQQLDKSTLSYASVFGLVEKAHLHGSMYSWLGSVVYVAQLVFQPLVAYLLVRVPLGKFMAVSVLLWGIALSCMTAAESFAGLMVCRLFLGIFEAGIGESCPPANATKRLTSVLAPAFIAVTQIWYRRREQPVRLGSWYAMNGVVNMVRLPFRAGILVSKAMPNKSISLEV
jgi:Major Facilitator Superfamily.